MATLYKGGTANSVWKQAALELLQKLNSEIVPSRAGNTSEVLQAVFSISNPRERWVTCRVPSISPAFALAEVVTIVNACNDAFVLNNWNPSLPKYQGQYEKYPGAYGERIRVNFGIDQLERSFLILKNNPNSRQAVVLIWDPTKDLSTPEGTPTSDDIPCNICSLLKLRDNRLYWTQITRSNDLNFGTPYNFVQFTFLHEIMAGWLGVELGEYVQMSDSLHLYSNSIMAVAEKSIIANTDIISVDKNTSEECFKAIFNNMLFLCNNSLSADDIISYSTIEHIPQSFNNIMIILAAYIANKRSFFEATRKILERCSNAIYLQLWHDWINSKIT